MPLQYTSLVQTVAIVIAGASLLLNYFSHRASVIDSAYERESKIDEKIGKIPRGVGNFSSDGYTFLLKFIKSTIYPKPLTWYSWRFVSPFGDIEGITQLSFKIQEPPDELVPGKYLSQPDDDKSNILAIGANIEPETGGLFHVLIDSVDVTEVGLSIADIERLDYTFKHDSQKFDKIFQDRSKY